MDFEPSEVQQRYQNEVSKFVEDEVIGESLSWDDGENFPDDVYETCIELGLCGLFLPEDVGGQDLDALTVGMIYEQLGRGDVSLPMLFLVQNGVNDMLYRYGDERQRELAVANSEGENKLCFAVTEPEHGSDAAAYEASAELRNGEWLMNGTKTAVTGATVADYAFTAFRIEEEETIGAFIVPLDADGVEVSPYEGMGCETEGWGQIFFDDARIEEDARIGERSAFKMAMEFFDVSRPSISAYSLGAAQQTLDETKEYLVEREAFGKPIASYEGPMFQVAEMQTHLDCARLKTYEALWKADQGIDQTMDAAMSKWYTPKVCVDVIQECLVLHGHYGYSKDFGIEKRLRDVLGQRIADGTPQIQKLIIGREIFGREHLPY